MMRFLILLLISGFAYGSTLDPCTDDKPLPPPPPPKPTDGYELKQSYELRDTKKRITEVSGIDVSTSNKDLFYAHNDSGDRARVFGFSLDGQVQSEIEFEGASARDWEDMTTAPCACDKGCIVVADMGDNSRKRNDYRIWYAKDPSVPGKHKVKAKSYGFKYSDGKSHNAEGFSYNPKDGHFYIATKGDNKLFRFPKVLSEGMKIDYVCDFDVKKSSRKSITGLDFSDQGRMLVRTYSDVYEFDGPRCDKELSFSDYDYKEKQGEAIAYLEHGRKGFVSVSEGLNPKIYVFK